MKNIFLLLILLLYGTMCKAQTLDETYAYISRVSDGKEQVIYDKEQNVLLLVSVRQIGGGLMTFVNQITPQDVKSVSVKEGKGGWNSINLNFKTNGATVYNYRVDRNFDIIGEIDNNRQYGINISIECDKTQIEKLQKAYIHLFKLLGVTVTDGEIF
jgi:hypothetical protein